MKFKDENGELATSDAQNAFLVTKFFKKVFNRDADVDQNRVNGIKQKVIIDELGEPLCFNEFCYAINKLMWHKASGINGTSPNVMKYLDANNKMILFEFIETWMDD